MTLQQTLALLAIGIEAAKATGKIDPVILGYIQTADDAIGAALTAVQQAKTQVDPAALKPIEPVV